MTPVDQDEEHLRLLSIFHYVVGGLGALFACFPLIYLAFGVFALAAPRTFTGAHGEPAPVFVGWLLIALGGGLTLIGWTAAGLAVYAGRCLARRAHYTFCFVMACAECLFAPFGTVLGIFTILVLNRPGGRALFGPVPAGAPAAPPR